MTNNGDKKPDRTEQRPDLKDVEPGSDADATPEIDPEEEPNPDSRDKGEPADKDAPGS